MIGRYSLYRHLRTLFSTIALKSVLGQNIQYGKNTRGVKVESKYMTLEEYAATLKVGDEVTIEYYSISGDRQTKEKF